MGLLRKLLRETSRERAEWILWLDADTLIEEMAFQIPFHAYRGKSFVAWGNADYLWAGDQFHGELPPVPPTVPCAAAHASRVLLSCAALGPRVPSCFDDAECTSVVHLLLRW